ncbi:MAG: asparagine synthase (glutamine-hydrolyzing) [Bacteroidota bacterium]
MCGIHGFIDIKINQEEKIGVITKMLNSTAHRGPDFSSFRQSKQVVLGHNRLSIIDLSSNANQPFQKHQFLIVFNGEIYNYKEIRKELQQQGVEFLTESDTEVIVESFKKWGEDCVSKFLGMWAFAIWNEETEELFCSRDRFGIKPFYYLFQQGRFYFASEVKALKFSPLFANNLNLNQVSRSIQLGWMHFKDETIYSGVKILEPAKNLVFKNGELIIKDYWSLSNSQNSQTNRENAVEEFRDLFDDALQLHLRSDVQLSATLSGGIDSSSIVCSILKNDLVKNLKTFSIYFEGEKSVDERPFVDEIIMKYGGKFENIFASPKESQVLEYFDTVMHINDFPILGSSCLSHYYIIKLIADQGIKVVLSGQGADDYLGGYMHSYYRLYAEYLRNFKFGSIFREFNKQAHNQQFNFSKKFDVASKSFLSAFLSEEQLYQFEYDHYFPKSMHLDKKYRVDIKDDLGFKKLNQFHDNLMSTSSLPTILHYEDRISMAHSIECRVPFLDHRLVEFAFKLPSDYKIHKGWTKWILREAMKDRLPEKIRYRTDKKGFVAPGEVLWLRGSLKHLLEIDYRKLDFLDKKIVSAEIESFKKGNDKNANFIWRIASLNYWIKNFN